ncbi:Silver exporting P-type ATPase [Phycisphaerae bacterium RAS1]|nr:Silver exporting P-type ATPase [Phycisphaerae bacterium RAS1]
MAAQPAAASAGEIEKSIQHETGRASAGIIATFIGGMLLLNALVARFVFHEPLYSGGLAMLAAILLGAPLIWQAVKDLWLGKSQMNELVALGVVAAFANGDYFAAGGISFFMIISMLVETRTALGARKSIESLVRITPTRAHKVTPAGEVEIEAKELRPGDVVRVRPGDNIPGDGQVLTGASTVNQASITGESLPAEKTGGDDVFGGTINLTGVLDIQITKAGKDTTLGRVQELILQAEQTRTPIMRLADQYASWYTPTVLMLAGIVLFLSKDLNRAISMLLIACPFSIILATPTALVAALSAAARLGVLIKNVTDLELARNLTAMVFDKTGTLTTGRLTVTRLKPAANVDPAALLLTATIAEQNSRHPVARAVMDVARKARVHADHPETFEEVSGKGVRAVLGSEEILVGRGTWLVEKGLDISGVDTSGDEGLSLLYVARGGRVLGWIGLEDKTRPDAAKAMDDLRESGLRNLVMVTGDRWSVARKVASEMHCTEVQAEVLPAEKLDIVDQLKRDGHLVAVVGDGVNDAPALAAGHVAIAMGAAGSDVAIHSASIALMNNNLNRIPFLVKLSNNTVGVIRQNMIFSVAYIVLLLVLSAAGYVHPVFAALLQAVSSIFVVFNSARLVREGENIDTIAYEEEERPRIALERVPATA